MVETAATNSASAPMPELIIRPLSDALGAEVLGVDATALDDEIFARVRDAFHDNIVLVIRDQALTPVEQTAFARRFGDIQYHINPEYLIPDQPEVMVLSTEKENGKPLGNANAGADWHSDHSYVDQPTGYTILQSVKVPKIGGDTEWINMVKAYETLPDDLKRRLKGLVGVHSFNRGKNPRLEADRRPDYNADYYAERSPPDAFHPIVRTHPYTGRKALFVSPRFTIAIRDMADSEAQPLLDRLFEHLLDQRFIYHHCWRPGDLLMWDNRSTIHLACGGVQEPEVRRMHRVTVLGEIPV